MAETNRFTVLRDFYSKELRSQYVAGLSYRVTEQNAAMVERWLAGNLVRMGGTPAKVTATGAVKMSAARQGRSKP